MYAKGAVNLDSVPALVTPGISLVASQVKVARKGASQGKSCQVLPSQDLPSQLWTVQLVFWTPRGCHRFKHHVFSYHPVFQPCQGDGRERSSTPSETGSSSTPRRPRHYPNKGQQSSLESTPCWEPGGRDLGTSPYSSTLPCPLWLLPTGFKLKIQSLTSHNSSAQ